ncbi:SlyX family protein [Alsobacter sp. SYSU M60028]|uniref:Protein SlyX homolog n=1 Tax=Alsobacter ponti TaxID=2962936 RepID=A0ABT1L8Z3_9HYPH|nr:SlyX family protein [Alsobacter ponti]MCP8937939.1 SlyX family protein [Alsobacter ponti]
MPEPDPKDRLDDIETRLAYQDQAMEDLNAAVTAQWTAIEDLTRRLAMLTDRLQAVEDRPASDPGDEPPPPHY